MRNFLIESRRLLPSVDTDAFSDAAVWSKEKGTALYQVHRVHDKWKHSLRKCQLIDDRTGGFKLGIEE